MTFRSASASSNLPQTVAEDRVVVGNHQTNWLRLSKIHAALPRSEAL